MSAGQNLAKIPFLSETLSNADRNQQTESVLQTQQAEIAASEQDVTQGTASENPHSENMEKDASVPIAESTEDVNKIDEPQAELSAVDENVEKEDEPKVETTNGVVNDENDNNPKENTSEPAASADKKESGPAKPHTSSTKSKSPGQVRKRKAKLVKKSPVQKTIDKLLHPLKRRASMSPEDARKSNLKANKTDSASTAVS